MQRAWKDQNNIFDTMDFYLKSSDLFYGPYVDVCAPNSANIAQHPAAPWKHLMATLGAAATWLIISTVVQVVITETEMKCSWSHATDEPGL